MERRLAVVLHDLFVVGLAWLLACLASYNFIFSSDQWQFFVQTLPVVVAVQGAVSWMMGLYRGVWRFASIPDLWNISRAVFIGFLLISLSFFFINRLEGIPRSAFVFYPIFLLLFLGGPRVLYRVWKDHGLPPRNAPNRKRVLIIGAGRAGEMLVRDMRRDREYKPVGFLDDSKRLRHAQLQGLPVFGEIKEVEKILSGEA